MKYLVSARYIMKLLQQIKYIHKMSYYIYSNKYQAHVKVRDNNCHFSDFFQGFCEPVLLFCYKKCYPLFDWE